MFSSYRVLFGQKTQHRLKIHTLPEGEILSDGVNGTGPDKVRRLRGC